MKFFLGCYEFIEEYLRRVVEAIINTGKMPRDYNNNFIALIPKEDNPTKFQNFLPISL
jgi:hypothetical protein